MLKINRGALTPSHISTVHFNLVLPEIVITEDTGSVATENVVDIIRADTFEHVTLCHMTTTNTQL